jgi:hypothetical protein
MYFSIRARVYADSAQVGAEDGWQDPVRSNYVPDVPPFFPFTPPIVLTVVVADDVPSGPAKLEIEVADNSDRLKARIVRVQIPIFWRSM